MNIESSAIQSMRRVSFGLTIYRNVSGILRLNRDMAQPQRTRNEPRLGIVASAARFDMTHTSTPIHMRPTQPLPEKRLHDPVWVTT